MKNLSINHKLFLSLSCIVLTVLFTILILNSTVLETYYIRYKEKSLIKTFNSFNSIYNDTYVDKKDLLNLEKIEINQNIDIVIKDFEKITVYSTQEDFTGNMFFMDRRSKFAITDFFEKKLISSEETYSTELLSSSKSKLSEKALSPNCLPAK